MDMKLLKKEAPPCYVSHSQQVKYVLCAYALWVYITQYTLYTLLTYFTLVTFYGPHEKFTLVVLWCTDKSPLKAMMRDEDRVSLVFP